MMSRVERLKISIAAALLSLALAPAAYAQPTAAPAGSAPEAPSTGYILVVAQSAFGNVTSQSFGGELGFTLQPRVQLFVDVGKIRDAAPASLGASAQTIAAG